MPIRRLWQWLPETTEVSGSDSIRVEYFATDGGLAFNDWTENPDGEATEDQVRDNIAKIGAFGSEGQYGPVHDWGSDPDGASVVAAIDTSGRPDLQSWVRDRRTSFEAVVERYPGGFSIR